MNIFKILANGDGTINEANVSAFLGYLIDPKADHALGYEFLQRFFKNSVEEEQFNFEQFEYEIFYEQAFREGNKKKEIVDIVVVCYSIDKGNAKESLVKNFLTNKKEVHKLFLIENKIRAGSVTAGQLLQQFNSTKHELGAEFENKIHSIYITPKNEKLQNEFLKSSLTNSTHLFWKSTEGDENAVNSMIREILELESLGDIEPLNEYTLHTIKAFNKFIENDFKSEKQEERERVNDGSYTKKFEDLNHSSNIESKLEKLRGNLIELEPSLSEFLSEVDMSDKRHPCLSIFYKGIRIVLGAGYVTRDRVGFTYLIDRSHPNSRARLEQLAKYLSIDIKKPNDKYGVYCKTEDMKKTVKLINTQAIRQQLSAIMKHIDEAVK